MSQSIGNERPQDRTDRNGDGVADKSVRDFKEAGQAQPQPSEQRSGGSAPTPAPQQSTGKQDPSADAGR